MFSFLKSWEPKFRTLFIFMLLFALLLGAYCLYLSFMGFHHGIAWEINQQKDQITLGTDTFQLGLFDLTVEADFAVVLQQFKGGILALPIVQSYVCFGLLLLGILTAFTFVSYLAGAYYYIGNALFALFLISLRIETFEPFGISSPAIMMFPILLFGGLNYYYNSIHTHHGFWLRWASMLGFAAIGLSLLAYNSHLQHPLYMLYNQSMIMPLILTMMVIGMVAYEILYGCLYLVSHYASGTQEKNTSLHFIGASVLYLINVLLVYLHNIRAIDWDIFYLNPFFLLVVSMIVGFWAWKQRSDMTEERMPFMPHGAFVYVSLCLVALSTIAYVYVSGNDALIEALEDVILYTHLGFGVGFFLFVVMRYKNWVDSNLRVDQVVFQSGGYPMLTIHGLGLIIAFSLLMKSKMFAYNQTIAGYFNGIGDAYMAENDLFYAKEYYKHALGYEYQNHKSNYSLGHIYLNENQISDAVYYFKQALNKQPSAFAVANLSNTYFENRMPVDAIESLQEGLRLFPNHSLLQNNLALIYNKLDMQDSAWFYLNKASQQNSYPAVIASNQLAFYAIHRIASPKALPKMDEISDAASHDVSDDVSDDLGYQTNRLAYEQAMGLTSTFSSYSLPTVQDSILTPIEAVYWQNYGLRFADQAPKSILADAKILASKDTNHAFRESLDLVQAWVQFYQGDIEAASQGMDILQQGSPVRSAYYTHTLGLWMLKRRQTEMATSFFEAAIEKGNTTDLINRAIAQSESRPIPSNVQKSAAMWFASSLEQDTSLRTSLAMMRGIYQAKINEALNAEEPFRYGFYHYRKDLLHELDFPSIYQSFQTKTFRFRAGIDLIRRYMDQKKWALAYSVLDELKEATWSDQEKVILDLLYLQCALYENNVPVIQAQINLVSKKEDQGYVYWGKAKIAAQQKNIQDAEKYYLMAFERCLTDAKMVQDAALYFHSVLGKQEQAFRFVEKALRICAQDADMMQVFVIQSVLFGIPSFAQTGIEELQGKITQAEMSAFLVEVEKAKQDFQKSMQ